MAVKFGLCVLFAFITIGLSNGFDDYWDYIYQIEDKAPFKALTDKHDFLDWKLFQVMGLAKKNENIVISPFAVKLLLSILKEAAASTSLLELGNVLVDLPRGKPGQQLFQDILTSLEEKNKDYKLDFGTMLYLDKSRSPKKTFLDVAKSVYHTSLDYVEFNKAQETANKINNWCAKVTNGNIKDLVTQDKLQGILAILANAIYFKGAWVIPFDENDNLNKQFTLRTGQNIPIKVMTQLSNFYYLHTKELGGAKFLRMAYKGSKYAMTFILPDKADGLDRLLEDLTRVKMEELQKEMKLTSVSVHMPKFEFETKSELRPILEKLNLKNIFQRNADLPGLDKDLYVSDIIQKAGVKVDEKGTEIYAATELELTDRSGSFEQFRAYHPFVFFLEDEKTGALLFAGKVVDPTKH